MPEQVRAPRDAGAPRESLDPAAPKLPRYPINSVDNALEVLPMLRTQRLIRVSEVSDRLGVSRSTAHRLLAMLEYRGFIRQDADTKAYRSGPALVDIGLSIVRSMDVRANLRPYLERIRDELGETVQLMVLDGPDALFIDCVESSQALRTGSRIGRSYPAYATSGGKALLAELSPERLEELYPSEALPAVTPGSLSSRAELRRELELTRRQGYGVNWGESEPDVAAVAVAVPGVFDAPPTAIAVSAPISRLGVEQAPLVAKAIAAVAGPASAGQAWRSAGSSR